MTLHNKKGAKSDQKGIKSDQRKAASYKPQASRPLLRNSSMSCLLSYQLSAFDCGYLQVLACSLQLETCPKLVALLQLAACSLQL